MHDSGNEHIHLNDIDKGIEQERVYDSNYKHSHSHTHSDGRVHSHEHSHDEEHVHGHSHKHVHSAEEKKAVVNRLARAIGHLEHVKAMVENDEDCSAVLIQLAAVRSAINATGRVILHNHINHCVVEAIEEKDMETVEMLEEAIKVFVK